MTNRKAPDEKPRRSHGRKVLIGLTFGALLFALCPCTHAQQQARISKIGWLSARRASNIGQEIIVRMLRDLGYVEGKNVAFEYRFTNDDLDRLPALADELVRLKVDVLFTAGTPGALALKKSYSDYSHRFCRRHRSGCGWTG